MRECDPKDKLANRLIRLRGQVTASHATASEADALMNIFQGMNDVLELIAKPPKSGRKSGRELIGMMMNRVALIMDGLKEYSHLQINRVSTFACCVEAAGTTVTDELERINSIKNKIDNYIKDLDDAVSESREANSSEQLERIGKRMNRMRSTLQKQSAMVQGIDKDLRKKAERVIQTSVREDDLARSIWKGLVLPSQDDPGSENPV